MKLPSPPRASALSPATRRWVALFAIAGALQVWVHLESRQIGYEIGRIREVKLSLDRERRELDMEIATLESKPEIDRVARERLGLVPPREGQLVGLP
jgi:cell division protein FtsL